MTYYAYLGKWGHMRCTLLGKLAVEQMFFVNVLNIVAFLLLNYNSFNPKIILILASVDIFLKFAHIEIVTAIA